MKHISIPIILVLVGIAIFISANLSGFCWREMRLLSQDEKKRLAIEALIHELPDSTSTVESLRNSSVDQFLEKYPDCCEFSPPIMDNYVPVKFLEKALGYCSDVIGIFPKKSHFSEAQKKELNSYKVYARISNCGEVEVQYQQ